MNARQKEAPPASTRKTRLPRIGRGGRWFVVAAIIVTATTGAAYAVWQQVRDHVVSSAQYQVEPDNILISPQPGWIRSDVKREVIREASFAGPLSLLEPALTVRVASAFAAHPWIGHVERVSKRFPSGLEVVVAYRQPVAMVEVPDGALPVDALGVVLPTSDFQPGEAERFPRISEIHSAPAGLVGSAWGDEAVSGAAEIAAVLLNDWESLGLFRIAPAGRRPGGRGGAEYAFVLFTRAGSRIDWGMAPSTKAPGEIPVGRKVAGLRKFAAEHGSLDPSGPQQLRFTARGELEALPRPPVRPLPQRN